MLDIATWSARRAAHEARVDVWTEPLLARRARNEAHPVDDFLFGYYSFSPGQLRTWSPGIGVDLEGEHRASRWEHADGVSRLGPVPDRVRRLAGSTAVLLERTAARPGRFGCFNLHEWAMVHRTRDVRHPLPLRLGPHGTDTVVETLPLACTHVDAARFFTPSAVGLNAFAPTRATQVDLEQPGCLHATMDLYKGAFQLAPWVPAELVADCFELARRVRVLDMRASPYDVRGLGLTPVAVETPGGRAEYVRQQRALTDEAAPLRERLLQSVRLVA